MRPRYTRVLLSNYSTGQTFACLRCPSDTTAECSSHGQCVDAAATPSPTPNTAMKTAAAPTVSTEPAASASALRPPWLRSDPFGHFSRLIGVGDGEDDGVKWVCACDPSLHFTGPACDACVRGWAPPACVQSCPGQCAGIGNCSGTPSSSGDGILVNLTCVCPPRFDPRAACANCTAGFYGQACDANCPGVSGADDGSGGEPCFGHGSCDDGKDGTGLCSCNAGYVGNCSGVSCAPGYAARGDGRTAL